MILTDLLSAGLHANVVSYICTHIRKTNYVDNRPTQAVVRHGGSTLVWIDRVVSSEISGNFPQKKFLEIYSNLSGNLLKNFFHFIHHNYNHIKINNKRVFDKQLSKSFCFKFLHYI